MEKTRNERIKEIELLLTHPCDLGVKWRALLVRELISYIAPEPKADEESQHA